MMIVTTDDDSDSDEYYLQPHLLELGLEPGEGGVAGVLPVLLPQLAHELHRGPLLAEAPRHQARQERVLGEVGLLVVQGVSQDQQEDQASNVEEPGELLVVADYQRHQSAGVTSAGVWICQQTHVLILSLTYLSLQPFFAFCVQILDFA